VVAPLLTEPPPMVPEATAGLEHCLAVTSVGLGLLSTARGLLVLGPGRAISNAHTPFRYGPHYLTSALHPCYLLGMQYIQMSRWSLRLGRQDIREWV
jgi:hypothetical protein